MPRYIDADALKSKIRYVDYGGDMAYDDYVKWSDIVNAPTVDERPTEEWEFAKFVARSIFEDDFEENPSWFIELACRRLVKLGIVKFSEDRKEYSIEVNEEGDV